MSYRLEDDEQIPGALRRIVREQVNKALDRLRTKTPNTDCAIHDARVCFKKVRAVLRLVRNNLGGEFDAENAFYRDLGRKLSAVRNNAAIIESFEKLNDRFRDQLSDRTLSRLRRPFLQSNARQQSQKRKASREVALELRPALRRLPKWPIDPSGFSDLRQGLKQTYKKGRERFAVARDDPTVENLHEWRKRVKNLWYQVRILRPMWPKVMRRLGNELEKLGDCLSDDHDLALLRQQVAGRSRENDRRHELEALLALIDERRAELQLEATLLGRRIFAEKPADFAARAEAYWDAWRAEIKTRPAAARAAKPVPQR